METQEPKITKADDCERGFTRVLTPEEIEWLWKNAPHYPFSEGETCQH